MASNAADDNSSTFAANEGPSSAASNEQRISLKKRQIKLVKKMVGTVLKPIKACRQKRVSIIDQLRSNDGDFTVLKLDGSHTVLNLDRLVDAIEINTTVKQIQIHGGLVSNLPLEEQHLLWHAIGRLPALEEIHFKHFLEFPLMVDGLNCLLERARQVKKLTIYDSVLYSRQSDEPLISLENHVNLKTVFFSQLRIPEERVLDPIVNALLTAPNLANLTIRVPRKKRNMLHDETLRKLVASKSLKVLELRRIVLKDAQIIQLAKHLEAKERAGSSKLKEVTIQCDDCLRETCCEALGTMLKTNAILTRLEVWGQKVEEDGFCFVINALQNNNTLKVLHLSHDIGPKGNAALANLLKNNFVLETLYMRSFGDPTMMANTDYFLKLNATNLRGLQLDINMDRALLVNKLDKHREDINHVYFLLRGNPNVFNADQLEGGDDIEPVPDS